MNCAWCPETFPGTFPAMDDHGPWTMDLQEPLREPLREPFRDRRDQKGSFGMALFNGGADSGAKESNRKPNFGTFGPNNNIYSIPEY